MSAKHRGLFSSTAEAVAAFAVDVVYERRKGPGATLLAGRIVHALGLLLQTGPSIGRVLGMALTWIALLAAGVGLIAYGVL